MTNVFLIRSKYFIYLDFTNDIHSLKTIFLFFILFSFISPKENATIYIMVYEDCPVCIYMSKPLQDVYKKHGNSFKFKLVFSNKLSNYKTINTFKKKYGLTEFESVLDADQAIAKKLGATITPEAIIVDQNGKVNYRGRISNAYYAPGKLRKSNIVNDLSNNLDSFIAGKVIESQWPKAVGCYITFDKK